jgi:hypothetical protein
MLCSSARSCSGEAAICLLIAFFSCNFLLSSFSINTFSSSLYDPQRLCATATSALEGRNVYSSGTKNEGTKSLLGRLPPTARPEFLSISSIRNRTNPNKTLAVAAIAQRESHALAEWVEHYIGEGASYFYLVNDDNENSTEREMFDYVLRPYADAGLVTTFHLSTYGKYSNINEWVSTMIGTNSRRRGMVCPMLARTVRILQVTGRRTGNLWVGVPESSL